MLILESVVTTRNPDGSPHIAPLGKRYARDEEPDWGCAVEREQEDLTTFKQAGATQRKRNKKGDGDADT